MRLALLRFAETWLVMDLETEYRVQDAAYCAALVRAEDRDRFLAAQFAPEPARARLLALLALNAEIARVPRTVRETPLAEIRLKWWHDAVMAILDGKPPPRQPALAAFARAVAGAGLAGEIFGRLIEAHTRDLNANPLRDLADAESHADGLSGTLALAALALLGVTDEASRRAARAAGIALALIGFQGGDEIRAQIVMARMEAKYVRRAALPILLWATVADIRWWRRMRGKTLPSPWLPLQLAWRAWRGRY